VPGNWPALFGKGPTEQDPDGHLAGGLLHSEGGVGRHSSAVRPAPTLLLTHPKPCRSLRLVGMRARLVCATKRTDGMRGKRHRLYRQTMSRWAVASRGCTLEVQELALIGTHEPRGRPPRRGARLRSRMVKSHEAGVNRREMIPLPRHHRHSWERSALAETRQRLSPLGYRGGLLPSTSPQDEAGHLNIPGLQSGDREEREGLSDNRHLHDSAESISVNVGGSWGEGCSSPLNPMSVGGPIVVRVRESRVQGEGGQGSNGPQSL
jgi:hypothetical protein